MGLIPTQNARKVFTTVLANMFEDLIEAPSFLRSFATEKVYRTKTVQLLSRRGTEQVAVDVIRGDRGNHNKMSVFTQKEYLPPYFKELLDITAMDVYDIPFYAGDRFNVAQIDALAHEAAISLNEIKKKVDRAIEVQAAQVFETGIVTVKNGDSIDYKRKAEMIEVLSGADLWDATGVDIIKFFEDKGALLRKNGKVSGSEEVDAIMGIESYQAFRTNPDINNDNNMYMKQNVDLSTRMKNKVGASYKGTVKAGGYNWDLWTYDEVRDNTAGVSTRYFNSKFVVLVPQSLKMEVSFGQVPTLPSFIRQDVRASRVRNSLRNKMKGFDIFDYVNEQDELYTVGIKAAPLVQLISVDRLYTAKVLA